MPKKITYLIAALFLSVNIAYSQNSYDTTKIASEIRALTNDSLIDAYWLNLQASDQDLNTFNNPVQQVENLLKSCFFFRKFGFSENNRFDTTAISYNDAEMHAKFIWMHSAFADLNAYTFPMYHSCLGVDDNANDPFYYLQNVQIALRKKHPELYDKTLIRLTERTFNELDFDHLFDLANEYYQLHKHLDSVETIGKWKIVFHENTEKELVYRFRLIKTKNNKYYFESIGTWFRMLKDQSQPNTYYFFTNLNDTHLEIPAVGELLVKDPEGNILEIMSN